MIPTKTYPLSAIMGNELTDKERIAELEAQLKHCEGHAAELETEVKALRDSDYQRHARSLEQRLGLAVAALESVAGDSEDRFIRNVARAALAQIEKS